jgi:hypothetical protein
VLAHCLEVVRAFHDKRTAATGSRIPSSVPHRHDRNVIYDIAQMVNKGYALRLTWPVDAKVSIKIG